MSSSLIQLLIILLFLAGPPLLRVILDLADKARQRRMVAQQEKEREMGALRPGGASASSSTASTDETERGRSIPRRAEKTDSPFGGGQTSTASAPDRDSRGPDRRQAEIEEWRRRRRQVAGAETRTELGPGRQTVPSQPPTSTAGPATGPAGNRGSWSVPGDPATARAEMERRRREAIDQIRRQTETQRAEELRRRALAEERERQARDRFASEQQRTARDRQRLGGSTSPQHLTPRQIEDLLSIYAAQTGRRLAIVPPDSRLAGRAASAGVGFESSGLPPQIQNLIGRRLEPDDLRSAVILKELLDAPVSLRNEPPAFDR